MRKTVALCDTQPVTAEGIRALLASCSDLQFSRGVTSLPAAREIALRSQPAVLILDKAFGAQAVLECLEQLKSQAYLTAPVVWGVSMTEAETLRFIQAGAKGIIRKSADLESLLICLRSVATGATWMEQNVFPDAVTPRRNSRGALTARERQVLELAGQGLKNREIGAELGIRPGTVKVHLKHIFEKTGVQGRYGLALTGLGAPETRTAPTVPL